MPKFYAVELRTVAIVQVPDDQDAEHAEIAANELQRDILRDVLSMEISVDGVVSSQRDLVQYGWDGKCVPYNGDGKTRLRDLLPASGGDKEKT